MTSVERKVAHWWRKIRLDAPAYERKALLARGRREAQALAFKDATDDTFDEKAWTRFFTFRPETWDDCPGCVCCVPDWSYPDDSEHWVEDTIVNRWVNVPRDWLA